MIASSRAAFSVSACEGQATVTSPAPTRSAPRAASRRAAFEQAVAQAGLAGQVQAGIGLVQQQGGGAGQQQLDGGEVAGGRADRVLQPARDHRGQEEPCQPHQPLHIGVDHAFPVVDVGILRG